MSSESDQRSKPDRPPRRLSRRRLFKLAAGVAAAPVVAGAYATQVEPFWPRLHQVDLPVAGLPGEFDGFRIAHLSDLHAGRVPFSYLKKTIGRVAALKPDLVVVSGDLTQHDPAWVTPVSDLLGSTGLPTVVTFGNHDYGVNRGDADPFDEQLDTHLEEALGKAGCHLLRNSAHTIERGGRQLYVVGMEDLWYGGFDAGVAFAKVPDGALSIAVSHNPDTVPAIQKHGPFLTLCGHTHGGQIRLPFIGALRLNINLMQYDRGLFDLGGPKLYVSAGVGYIRRVRFYCRPEVPVFRLTAVRGQ